MIPTLENIIRDLITGRMSHDEALRYLQLHEEAAHAAASAAQVASDAQINILAEIVAERENQDAKFGDQSGNFDFDPVLERRDGGCDPQRMAEHYEIPSETRAKSLCKHAFANGEGTWMHVLVEEVAEACGCVGKPKQSKHLREELVQVAAVAVAWIEYLDRRSS